MIKKADLIYTLNNYRSRLPLVAFPMSLGINLKDNLQYLDFLTRLLMESDRDEIKLNDYSELQMYMQAVNVLNAVSELPNYGKDKESLEAIKKWYKKKFHIPLQGIIFVEDVYELVNKWREKEKYIKIPDEFEIEAYESVLPYLQKFKSLSREKQIEVQNKMQMLEKIKSPKTLFEKAKIMANNGLVAMVNKINAEQADKEEYIGHVFINLYFDFQKGDSYMAKSFVSINNWLTSGIDDKYRITSQTIQKMFARQPGNKAEEEKPKDPEDEKATAELKALGERAQQVQADDPEYQKKKKLRKQFDDQFRRIGIEFDGAAEQSALSQNIFENITPDTIVTEPSIDDYNSYLKINERATNSELAVKKRIDEVIANLTNQTNT